MVKIRGAPRSSGWGWGSAGLSRSLQLAAGSGRRLTCCLPCTRPPATSPLAESCPPAFFLASSWGWIYDVCCVRLRRSKSLR